MNYPKLFRRSLLIIMVAGVVTVFVVHMSASIIQVSYQLFRSNVRK